MVRHQAAEVERLKLERPLIIRSGAQLRALLAAPDLLAGRSLRLDLPDMPSEVSRVASGRIVRYARACGCEWGAAFMAGGFVVAVAWLVLTYDVLSADFLWRLPLTIAIGIASGAIGKLIGLRRARTMLKREIDTLLAPQPAPTREA